MMISVLLHTWHPQIYRLAIPLTGRRKSFRYQTFTFFALVSGHFIYSHPLLHLHKRRWAWENLTHSITQTPIFSQWLLITYPLSLSSLSFSSPLLSLPLFLLSFLRLHLRIPPIKWDWDSTTKAFALIVPISSWITLLRYLKMGSSPSSISTSFHGAMPRSVATTPSIARFPSNFNSLLCLCFDTSGGCAAHLDTSHRLLMEAN